MGSNPTGSALGMYASLDAAEASGDDYRGPGIPAGSKSLTSALRFRTADRTLTAGPRARPRGQARVLPRRSAGKPGPRDPRRRRSCSR
ncbi:hypothetical protein FVP33_15235 [Lacisediminihabitans profunda]|uniref:Uncharacterized protein n=1 Tax=Lacisediminihabitans profunda TaxID=2594790 RepID=A0A5C8UNR8_9MICO|nr:hypothetical protein FVP33_15235 [Lacisediminihabitans profunda]